MFVNDLCYLIRDKPRLRRHTQHPKEGHYAGEWMPSYDIQEFGCNLRPSCRNRYRILRD